MKIQKLMRSLRESRSESGQTLLFGMIAMVVLVVAIFILFDLQSTIRFKIKSQSAADAAALAGAQWQRHTLNLIGELNMVKACTVLITDATFGIGESTDTFLKDYDRNYSTNEDTYNRIQKDLAQLSEACMLLSQMQSRVSFVGPLVGLGAAQQAAKNNGVNYSSRYSDFAKQHYLDVCNDTLYGSSVLSQSIPNAGYIWRTSEGGPYAAMLYDTLQMNSNTAYGFAADPNKKFMGYPRLSSTATPDFSSVLASKSVYDAILANNWCALRDILRMDYSGNPWWGDVTVVRDSSSFPYESEYMPVQVAFYKGRAPYASATGETYTNGVPQDGADSTNYLKSLLSQRSGLTTSRNAYTDDADPWTTDSNGNLVRNNADSDWRFYVLPRITWCIYDTGGDNGMAKWDSSYISNDEKEYLRGDIQNGYAYKSGAYTFMGVPFPAANLWISGNWSMQSNANDAQYLGGNSNNQAMRFGGSAGFGKKINTYADKLKTAEQNFRTFKNYGNNVTASSANEIWAGTAVAKPLGRFQIDGSYSNPIVSSMVLPVFDKVALIPMFLPDFSYSSQSPPSVDPFDDFFYFLVDYMPHLGTVSSLDEMPAYMAEHYPDVWSRVYRYHYALTLLNDASWRQYGNDPEHPGNGGISWLEKYVTYTTDVDGNQIPQYTNEFFCTYWPDGGTSPRSGPAVAH